MNDIFALVKDFGMQAVITICVLYGGWKMICRMMDVMESQNKRWQEVTDKLSQTIDNHIVDSKAAHQYLRSEHEAFAEQQKTQTETMRGIQEAVGRINGYTDKH